jgi:hypothetical protein
MAGGLETRSFRTWFGDLRVRIGERFFVATAAHVVQRKTTEHFFIGTPARSNGVLRTINREARAAVGHAMSWTLLG